MVQKQKPTVIHGLRINAELRNRIAVAMQKGGFSSRSAFIRAAVERELAGRESGVDADAIENLPLRVTCIESRSALSNGFQRERTRGRVVRIAIEAAVNQQIEFT